MVVFLGIQPGQMPEEPQPEGLDPFRDWQAACSAPDSLICSMSGVRDPKDIPQTPRVEGVKALSKHNWVQIHKFSNRATATPNDYMQLIIKPKTMAHTGSNECVLECN